MKIPRNYRFTKEISGFLAKIEANKEVINNLLVPTDIEENIRRQSILGSALFSARIEGNRLTRIEIDGFSSLPAQDKSKLEVANIHRAINLVLENFSDKKEITEKDILKLHEETMRHILAPEFSGKFRQGHEGVFDAYGNLYYHSPPPGEVNSLTDQLVKFINSEREKFIPIRAILAHLALEDIHPFIDGSGRVGRLLQLAVLVRGGYGMKGLVGVEELIDKNRQSYYRTIEMSRGSNDATEFVSLILEFLSDSSTKARELLSQKQRSFSPLDLLPPRRRELVEIIREHRMVSLDFLHRRFLRVSPRLLSYDLKKLTDKGIVVKIGNTRGALYGLREPV